MNAPTDAPLCTPCSPRPRTPDAGGQLHQYALGPPCSLLRRAPHDQFLTTDYNPLLVDHRRHVLDAVAQLPPHLMAGTCSGLQMYLVRAQNRVHVYLISRSHVTRPICVSRCADQAYLGDATGHVYPAALQEAYRAGRVLAAPPGDVAWREAGQEPGYLLVAPTLTAAGWQSDRVSGWVGEGSGLVGASV